MKKIVAEVIADSKSTFGHRAISSILTFPRIILAELNTHRMLTRNSGSSRAIPTKVMLKTVLDDPFVPIAWQKDHTGMQGTEYFSNTETFNIEFLRDYMFKRLLEMYRSSKDQEDKYVIIDQKVFEIYQNLFNNFKGHYTLTEFWLMIRDKIVESVLLFYCLGVTKQICNRLLEPFMWHTALVTATDLENFFHLRCPQYEIAGKTYRSKKDVYKDYTPVSQGGMSGILDPDDPNWFLLNKGQGEIHIMALAEAMWDAMNESVPNMLQPGQWHIPFGDQMDQDAIAELGVNLGLIDSDNIVDHVYYENLAIKIAVARAARVSYNNFDGTNDYGKDIALHDRLAGSGHWSPFEHCARAMTEKELDNNLIIQDGIVTPGVSGNFYGFIQYRKLFKDENKSIYVPITS